MTRLIITNDDGIDAPGLAALAAAASSSGEVFIVAPVQEWSGCGHRVTTEGAFRVERRGERAWAVHGTPADCVRVALEHLVVDADWVLAGINPGGNLGTDVYHSGTVAAAREAALHGRAAMAFSHYRRRGLAIDWPRTSAWTAEVIRRSGRPPSGSFLNVNFPHLDAGAALPAIVDCAVDPSPLPLAFRRDGDLVAYAGDYHARARLPGRDVATCFGGAISVSSMTL